MWWVLQQFPFCGQTALASSMEGLTASGPVEMGLFFSLISFALSPATLENWTVVLAKFFLNLLFLIARYGGRSARRVSL